MNISEEPEIEKITRDYLKNMKGFQKLLKKQGKEKENLKKKHNKERAFMQKQHSSVIDKMTAKQNNSSGLANGGLSQFTSDRNNNNAAASPNGDNETDNSFKQKMKEIIEEQSRAWANLLERQQSDEKALNNEHVEQQCNNFQQLLVEAQKQRKKDIESKQNK